MRRLLLIAFVMCSGTCVLAGPPFVTDDPEPVEFRNWEVYVSSIFEHDSSGSSGTLPHLEVNYGAAPNVQVHLLQPYAFNQPSGESTSRGLGDTELGVKYRFMQETNRRPMVGIFPLAEVPTGSSARGLGSGHLQFFLPVWLQKSWGAWTSYGGGGYFTNPGAGNRNFWLYGWEIQKDLSERMKLGGEIFGTTPDSEGASSQFNFNLGGIYSPDEGHHILFSAGRSIHGDTEFMSYLGFQWTFGPRSGSNEGGAELGNARPEDKGRTGPAP